MFRRQLPVYSRVSPLELARGAGAAIGGGRSARTRLRSALRDRFAAEEVLLTDSGTSALVVALRLAVPPGGTVALPAWACVDLAAAAIQAQRHVRFYDLDPATLSPDLDDVRRTVGRGVDAFVVAHLYGYPADMVGIRAITAAAGIPVIEDAAQAAAGVLQGRRLGSWGELVVLSFGRGKGLNGGGGGALLVRDARWISAVNASRDRLTRGSRGVRNVSVTAAQWLLGRPSLYAIPSGIPWLRLGEMVYHPAREPAGLPAAASALVLRALSRADAERDARAEIAARLRAVLHGTSAVPVFGIAGGASGYLRLPVLDRGGRSPSPAAGILRGYPGTLAAQAVLAPWIVEGERAGRGAEELGGALFTLPAHALVARTDIEAAATWARSG